MLSRQRIHQIWIFQTGEKLLLILKNYPNKKRETTPPPKLYINIFPHCEYLCSYVIARSTATKQSFFLCHSEAGFACRGIQSKHSLSPLPQGRGFMPEKQFEHSLFPLPLAGEDRNYKVISWRGCPSFLIKISAVIPHLVRNLVITRII